MKVTRLETIGVRMPVTRPLGNATVQIKSFSCLLIYLHTDEGLVGENLIFTIREEQLPLLDAMVRVLEEAVIGLDITHTEAFWADAWKRINFIGFTGVSIMGISAIDSALWDLRGKAAGLSISQLLGVARERVPAYASGGLWLSQNVSEAADEAAFLAQSGFRAMKARLSGHVESDIKRVAAIRSAIGPDVGLMVDVNQGIDVRTAIRLAGELEPYGISWFEEPIPAHDLEGLANVAAAISIPVASGENEYTRHGFRRMLDLKAADILMPDLQRVGGVTEFFKVGCLAQAYNVPVSSHLFPEMSLQLLGSLPNVNYLEHLEWYQPLYNEPLEMEDGEVIVPKRAGFGFSFNPTAVEHFRI